MALSHGHPGRRKGGIFNGRLMIAASNNDAASTTIDFSVDNVGFFKGTPPNDSPPGP